MKKAEKTKNIYTYVYIYYYVIDFKEVKNMEIQFDLQHFCCGPKGCEIEITYGEMMDAE
jgi:hypothetical protein